MPNTFRVTEAWSGRSVTDAPGTGASAVRVFHVTGTGSTVANEINALVAVDDTVLTRAVPQLNDAYVDPQGNAYPLLRCNQRPVKTISVGFIEVTCSYGVGQFQPPDPNPLNEPCTYSVDTQEIEEDVDHDFDGLPIVNLCGDPMPGSKRTFHVDVWTITKNLASYPYAVAQEYRNTVNDAPFVLNGVTVAKGYARVVSITPGRAFKAADTYVPVVTKIAIYDSQQMDNPWQQRSINQGSQCYGHLAGADDTSAKKGRIVFKESHDTPARDVLLDIDGKPFDTSIYGVRRKHGEQIGDTIDTSPVASDIISAMPIAPDTSVAGVVYLINRKCDESDFGAMLTALNIPHT